MEELAIKVMETSKKVLVEAHPDTLTSMANLASQTSPFLRRLGTVHGDVLAVGWKYLVTTALMTLLRTI